MRADKPMRAFVIYRHPVFALGVRDFLGEAPGIHIVGMEPEAAGVLEAARAVEPDVVILEEPIGELAPVHAIREIRTAQRVVTMSLGHMVATVYRARRLRVTGPSAVATAVHGPSAGRPRPTVKPGKEVMTDQVPV
ncbi:MAG: hypothetical protein ACE147_09095 [Candidatus Methylomirabilales bacterium]